MQKQLVMVMASVPSTSGTGGVASLTPRKPSASSLRHESTVQPYRSRSSTELRYARAQKRASGGSTPRTPNGGARQIEGGSSLLNQLQFSPYAESMDSLGNGASTRSSTRSRPQSKSNSRYASPRGAVESIANPKGSTSQQHVIARPIISTQPPPGQIAIEPFSQHTPKHQSANSSPALASESIANHHYHYSPYLHSHPTRARLQVNEAPQTNRTQHDQAPPRKASSMPTAEHDEHANGINGSNAVPNNHSHYPQGSPLDTHSTQLDLSYPSTHSYPLSPPSSSQSPQSHPPHQQQLFSPSAMSLDDLRPLPVQHTVTQGKHGVTEYVLSFREGDPLQFQPSPISSPMEYDQWHLQYQHQQALQQSQQHHHHSNGGDHAHADLPSPRSAAFEQWKTQHMAALADVASSPQAHHHVAKKEKKEKKKKKKDRDSSGLPDDAPFPSSPFVRKSSRLDGKKLCKVAGCGEARVGDTSKYCRAHEGPAPINPNARKMMFQH